MISPSCQFSRQNPSMWHKERPYDFHIASPWLRHFSKVEINGLEISDGRRWAGKVNVRFLSGKSSVNVQHGCMVNNMVCVERCLQGQAPYPTTSPTKKIMVLDLKIMVLYKVKNWDSKFIYRFWRSFQGPGALSSPILMLRVARLRRHNSIWCLKLVRRWCFTDNFFVQERYFSQCSQTPSKCIFHHLPFFLMLSLSYRYMH